ncbi:MAG: asparaginase domain-containing protein [Pseudomonadota bacterium]
MKQQVTILTTGGTIEKSYCESDGSVKNQEPQLKAMLLSRMRLPHTDFWIEEIMAKDSLDMTDQDRDLVVQKIREHSASKRPIVVLHGTDTMEKTILHCHHSMKPSVAVIFTGAMKPAGFIDSDAQQNFTEALFASQIVPPGFYISFHGHLFEAPHVRKNHDLGTFEDQRFPLEA